MNLSLSRRLILLVPVFVISTLGLGARAQDRNDARPNPKEMASLSMQIEQDGEARIMLSLPGKLDDAGVMRQALSQSFSFPVTIEPARANATLFSNAAVVVASEARDALQRSNLFYPRALTTADIAPGATS